MTTMYLLFNLSAGKKKSPLQHLCGLCFYWLRFFFYHMDDQFSPISSTLFFLQLCLGILCWCSTMTDGANMTLLSLKLMRLQSTLRLLLIYTQSRFVAPMWTLDFILILLIHPMAAFLFSVLVYHLLIYSNIQHFIFLLRRLTIPFRLNSRWLLHLCSFLFFSF